MPVNISNSQYGEHLEIWQTVRDCIAGQKKIKSKGTKYLPMPSKSGDKKADDDRYQDYKLRALFYNVTQRTLASLTGAGMRKSPEVDLPDSMQYLIDDADNSGNSLNQLANSVLHNVAGIGRHGLLVDYPSSEGDLSVEDVERLGLRPAIKEYLTETIINWRTDAGKLVLVVLKEAEEVDVDKFTTTSKVRYRVLELVDGVYEQSIYDEGGTLIESQQPKDHDGATWDVIPFVFAGSMNNSSDVDAAPMYDLAVVNISHYMDSADYQEGVFLHGQPMLHVDIGTTPANQWKEWNGKGIHVGARRAVITQGSGSATLLQAEANSAAYEAMAHKEKLMVKIGGRLVEEGGANETAQAVLADAATEHSVLSLAVQNVGEAIEQCLVWCAMFDGSNEDQVAFIMNDDFFDIEPNPQMIAALMGLEDRGHLAQKDIRSYMRKSGLLENDRTDDEIDSEVSEDAGINIE
jgi:hypothetical protein